MSTRPVIVGAVAYHERIVPIWERFREYFTDAGVPTDYVLYSNYERQVDALLAGDVDIAWNTNTAYVQAEHRIGGGAQLLGMRGVDRDFATVVVTPRDAPLEDLSELRGRRLAIGSRDSGHAAILPLHYLRAAGVTPDADVTVVRFDTDLGKHGDTGDSELRVVEVVTAGEADAGALGDATWASLRSQGAPGVEGLAVSWRSPTYYHCNFTALPGFDVGLAAAWSELLLAMSYDDPSLRPAMDLEGVKRWYQADRDGYVELTRAMEEQGYLT
jgi:ABC-type phosphate/phosphonate transport system substrate-binding protein